MNQAKLDLILKNHELWLNDEGGKRGDLSGANLSGVDLRYANLSDANLSYADLSGANLRVVDLRGADLSGVDLSDADLRRANLSGANLSGADLSGADLSGADLSDANLRYADLKGVNFSGANLQETFNLQYSQCSFVGMGERGRMLTGAVIDGELKFFCGCFSGSEDGLRAYIEDSADKYKQSRLLALEFVLNTVHLDRV